MGSSYAGLDNATRGANTITGGTKGEYNNTLTGMGIKQHQRNRKESGETPVVWLRNSHPDDNKQRMKAEMSSRVLKATGILIDSD